MPAELQRRSESDRGQVIVLFALSLVALLAMMGLIFDGGRIYTERRRAQNAADAAANAGAAALDDSNAPSSIVSSRVAAQTAACKAAGANGFGSGTFDNTTCGPNGSVVRVHVPAAADGTYSDGTTILPGVLITFEKPGYVQVAVNSSFQPAFAGVLGLTNFSASALAVAVNIPGHGVGYTLLVLDPINCGAFAINGGTTLAVHDGGVLVDSSAAKTADVACTKYNAATLTGGSSGNATLTTDSPFTNNVVGLGDATGVSPAWTTGADFTVDPLAGVHVPPRADSSAWALVPGQPGSEFAPVTWSNSKAPFPSTTLGLAPGVIWGGISVGNGDNLVLQGGTYIMAGGGFNVSGGTVSAMAPVTLIDTIDPSCNSRNAASCTNPGLKTNGDLPSTTGQTTGASGGSWGLATGTGTGPLTAPTANLVEPYLDGILIYVDRDILPCTGTPGNTTLAVGGSGSFYFNTGSIIYAPCSTVKLYGNGANQGGAVVSYQISINGGKSLDLGGPGTPTGAPSRSNLVQ